MLKEIENVHQIPGEPRRRWFMSGSFDLIVWHEPDGSILGFQLCYKEWSDEKALTWLKDYGYSHNRVDDGEGAEDGDELALALGKMRKMSPVLVADGKFDRDRILAAFLKESEEIPAAVAQFVAERLREYPA